MKTTAVVVNPVAGGGRARRVWGSLLEAAPELADAHLLLTGDAMATRVELQRRLAAGATRVIAIGGDGTAHLVANVLLAEGCGERVALGLVPAGTGSDLARSLGLPKRPEDALRHVLAATPRPLDAIAVEVAGGEPRFAVNIASAGLSGAVDLAVNANPHRGQLAYLAATLSGLLRYRPLPCRVTVDGELLHDGGFFVVAVANGQYFGKGMRVAPAAVPDDGLLDVVLVPPVPLWQLPFRLPQFLSGRHVELPFVICRRARSVLFEPGPGFPPYDLDGETLTAEPAELRVVPGGLRILA